MRIVATFLLFTTIMGTSIGQVSEAYTFKVLKQNDVLPVCSQGKTGTCWSFATASFLESEIIRMGKKPVDLSEMFIVKNVYKEKIDNYVRYHGKTNFGQGSLTHDYLNAAEKHGLMPHNAFYPEIHKNKEHNHAEMFSILKSMADSYAKSSKLSANWKNAINGVLDTYLGKDVEKFNYDDINYDPTSFKAHLSIDASKYKHVTSYTHLPMGESVVLQLPDNWARGEYENVPLHVMVDMAKKALLEGYTISWDADVSNKGFLSKEGIALSPSDNKIDFKKVKETVKEIDVTTELRQNKFDNHVVTDDHLMHITGIAKDQNGKTFFIVKNSWGTERGREGFEGYVFVSESYFKLNTISITFHQDALIYTNN